MGIEDFSTFLTKYAPTSYYQIPLTQFSGSRLAFDMDNLVYIMYITAAKQVVRSTPVAEREPDQAEINRVTLFKILERLTTFMYYKIGVVCCFDSEPNPLKDRVREVRKAKHKKTDQEFETIRTTFYSLDPLFRNNTLAEAYIKAYEKNAKPSWEFTAHVRNLLKTIGFPVLQVKDYIGRELRDENGKLYHLTGDAEGLAAALCIPGNEYCAAGVTTDSDFHAYGGNLAITSLETERRMVNGVHSTIHYAQVRSLEIILAQLGMNFETFRDVCIMLGTDYNLRIPGVGPVNIYNLIRKHGSIFGVATEKDITPYNYLNVLPIFQASLVKLNLSQPDFDLDKWTQNGPAALEAEGLKSYVKIINDILSVETIPIVQPELSTHLVGTEF